MAIPPNTKTADTGKIHTVIDSPTAIIHEKLLQPQSPNHAYS
jgi:hypothetical protein